jgi:hypothetical protein
VVKCDRYWKSWLGVGAAVITLMGVSGAARAEVFPTVTLINASDPVHPFNQAELHISRELTAPNMWRWTYDLDNLKDTGATSSKVPIRRFLLGIDPDKAGLDWQSHIWAQPSHHSLNEVPNPFVADGNANFVKPAILDSDDIEWNWDNGSTTNKNDDFLGGTMRFQFDTDLPSVTDWVHEARGSKGPGSGIGASPAAAATPEPASMALLLSGAGPLLLKLRRRRATEGVTGTREAGG